MKRIVFWSTLIATIAILTLSACQQPHQAQHEKVVAPQVLSIAYPHELNEIIALAAQSFKEGGIKLPNGAAVEFSFLETNSLAASQAIARGQIKPTLWVTPSLALVDYSNAHVINLGAKQVGCRKIFSTRLVGAMSSAQRKKIMPEGASFSRDKIRALRSTLAIAIPRADLSDNGIAAALYLMASNQNSLSSTKNLFSNLRRFGSESHLLETSGNSYFGLPRLSLSSEQGVIQHNRKLKNVESLLEALYPIDNGPELEYSVCISQADWMSPAQKSAGLLFQKHLLTQSVQIAAQQLGFRAVQYVSESISSFIPALGVQAVPEEPSIPITPIQIKSLLSSEDILNPKSATMYIIDCSGSMQGNSLLTAKRLVRSALEEPSDDSTIGIIAFSATPELISPPISTRLSLLPYLAGLEANGGSALYDALLLGAEQLQKPEFASVQRRLVVITDGNDQNSKTNLSFFGNAFQRRGGLQGLALSLFVFKNDTTDIRDLKQISDLLQGTLHTLSPSISAEEFKRQIELG